MAWCHLHQFDLLTKPFVITTNAVHKSNKINKIIIENWLVGLSTCPIASINIIIKRTRTLTVSLSLALSLSFALHLFLSLSPVELHRVVVYRKEEFCLCYFYWGSSTKPVKLSKKFFSILSLNWIWRRPKMDGEYVRCAVRAKKHRSNWKNM